MNPPSKRSTARAACGRPSETSSAFRRFRKYGLGIPIAAAFLCSLLFSAPASGNCSKFAPVGGWLEGLRCTYGGDPEADEDATPNWVVPFGVHEATFNVRGSDEIFPTGWQGGHVAAKLPLTPHEVLQLNLGFEGRASWISRTAVRLLVAGGGDRQEPNYVVPGAKDVIDEPAHPPETTSRQNGTISI